MTWRTTFWIFINYWTRLSKISWFVDASNRQITIFCENVNRVQSLFYHSLLNLRFIFRYKILWQRAFHYKSFFTKFIQQSEPTLFTKIEGNAHAQSIICSWATFLTNAHANRLKKGTSIERYHVSNRNRYHCLWYQIPSTRYRPSLYSILFQFYFMETADW
jgi:hypothetical protein